MMQSLNANNILQEKGPRNWANWVIIILGGALILYLGRSLFIPLSFSILLSFVCILSAGGLKVKG